MGQVWDTLPKLTPTQRIVPLFLPDFGKNSHKRSNDPHFVPDHFLLHIEEPESVPSSPRARLNIDSNTDHICSSNFDTLSIPTTGDQYLGSGRGNGIDVILCTDELRW